MATKILVAQSPGFSPTTWKNSTAADPGKISAILKSEIPNGDAALILAPASLRKDLAANFVDGKSSFTFLYFQNQAQADQVAPSLDFLQSPRTMGVKDAVTKGSTIFSETFFQAGKVGERLDPCFRFARDKLNPKRAVDAWGALHALLFLGISSLPDQGEKGTGERVDVQVSSDATRVAFTVRFDLPEAAVAAMRENPLLELPRGAVDFFELRYLKDAKKLEVLGIVFLEKLAVGAVEAQSFQATTALESNQDLKDTSFLGFGSMKGSENEEKRVIKGGFKKKFSDTIKISATPAEAETVTRVSAEKIIDADNGNFLVSGEVLQTNEKIVVSGSATLGKKEPALSPVTLVDAKGKSNPHLESKIEGLETTLKQREELINKLNKEIADIKDPLKMGVISGIKDNQVEGLKANITRLTEELAEGGKREKEMMAVVDKAIQMKDEAVKKFKELDTKLRQSQGGNNSKVQTLEKQMEEQKRQNKELSKKLSTVMDQLAAAGKKAA